MRVQVSEFRVAGTGFRVQVSEFRFAGLRVCGFAGSEFRVDGLAMSVQGSKLRVQGLKSRLHDYRTLGVLRDSSSTFLRPSNPSFETNTLNPKH